MSSLIVERIGPGATVQSSERSGHMHEGVPPGGPLVPELFGAANSALANAPDAAVIEAPLHPVALRAIERTVISVNGRVQRLQEGETFVAQSSHEAVQYIAVPGGVAVPIVLGGRGTLLAANFGGFQGRALRPGDVLMSQPAEPTATVEGDPPPPDPTAPIRVILGPEPFSPEAIGALLGSSFRVSPVLSRVGQRLEGPALPVSNRDRAGSFPMVRGALQITMDGSVFVLGPDHPTTGGYPVIGVVVTRDWGALARRRPVQEVRFLAV